MSWCQLALPELDVEVDKAIFKLAKEISKDIKKMEEHRAELDSQIAAVEAEDLATFDVDGAVGRFRQRKIFLLQQELIIRERITELCERLMEDNARLIEVFRVRADEAYKQVIEGLVGLGYVYDPNGTPLIPGWITPGFVMVHPAVVDSKNRHERGRNAMESCREFGRRNSAFVSEIQDTLAEIRQRILKGVSTI